MRDELETYNYYSDSRVVDSMRKRLWIITTTGNKAHLVLDSDFVDNHLENGVDIQETYEVAYHFEVCTQCRGSGTVVDPKIDCGGLTSEEFYDESFREDYMFGRYNTTCPRCSGLRVVPDSEKMLNQLPTHVAKLIEDWETDEDEYLQTQLSELRHGC